MRPGERDNARATVLSVRDLHSPQSGGAQELQSPPPPPDPRAHPGVPTGMCTWPLPAPPPPAAPPPTWRPFRDACPSHQQGVWDGGAASARVKTIPHDTLMISRCVSSGLSFRAEFKPLLVLRRRKWRPVSPTLSRPPLATTPVGCARTPFFMEPACQKKGQQKKNFVP